MSAHDQPISAELSDQMPEQLADQMPEQLADQMPEQLAEQMPEQLAEQLADQLPKQLNEQMQTLKRASRELRQLSAEVKSSFLRTLGSAILSHTAEILSANEIDLQRYRQSCESNHQTPNSAFMDRLTLNEKRVASMVESLLSVAALADPVGEVVEERTLSNGLLTKRVRSPLGVILMIFESRPNVILEAFSLAFKSGNLIVLRGGSESQSTAQVLYRIIEQTLMRSGLKQNFFIGIKNYDRRIISTFLSRPDWFDVVVPRGGDKLIAFVQEKALMPIIKNDRGLCHTYIDASADLAMAVKIVFNAKVSRPGVCNSLETVLVHHSVAEMFVKSLFKETEACGLKWRICPMTAKILGENSRVQLASDADWDTEHLDLIINCKIVPDLNSALEHIERHGSRHSEAIVTASIENAHRFQSEVDASAVYWNASTRFTDGFELGLGGELGISTQKLHVRGPVGLRELTLPRWIITGDGQTR